MTPSAMVTEPSEFTLTMRPPTSIARRPGAGSCTRPMSRRFVPSSRPTLTYHSPGRASVSGRVALKSKEGSLSLLLAGGTVSTVSPAPPIDSGVKAGRALMFHVSPGTRRVPVTGFVGDRFRIPDRFRVLTSSERRNKARVLHVSHVKERPLYTGDTAFVGS